MNTRSDQDVADLLVLSRKDAVSRLLKTMKTSRELNNAKIAGTLGAMNDEIEAVMSAIAGHVMIVGDRIGEELVANAVTRKEQIEALLPAAFTTKQRLIDTADVLFSKEPDDGRVTMLFFRREKIVAADHFVLGNGDPRDGIVSDLRGRVERAIRDQAISTAEQALGFGSQDDEGDASGVMPFAPETETKRQDGDAEAFARVDAILPETGAARRLFDLIRPYRDPSIRYRRFRVITIDALDHFLSYCAAHVKPLKPIASKVLDFRAYDDDVRSKRHRLKRVKGAYRIILRIPAYGRISRAIESLGEEDVQTIHMSIDPSALVESSVPSTDGAPRLIVETIDPELVEFLNDAMDQDAIPVMSPVVVMYRPNPEGWSAMVVIGSSQVEYAVGFDLLSAEDASPVMTRLISILARAMSKDVEPGTKTGDAAPARSAASPPPLVARVRFRVDDPEAAWNAIDTWHTGHLNKIGEDVLRSRAVDGSWLIEHLDGQDKSRRWSVRITAERTDRHVLTLELGADRGRNVIPRLPAVLRRIVATTTTRAIDGPMHASARTIQTRSDVEDVNRALRDPTRALPIVIVSSQGDQRLVEPDTLNVQTLGALDVWSIDASAYEMLEDRIGADMGVRAGETRIYMPGFTPDDSPFEHPVIHLSNSGHKRLSELVTREIGATLWRYASGYEGHDQAEGLAVLADRERPDPLPDAVVRENALPRVPSYRDIRRRMLPASAREPSPSTHADEVAAPDRAERTVASHERRSEAVPPVAIESETTPDAASTADEPLLPLEEIAVEQAADASSPEDAGGHAIEGVGIVGHGPDASADASGPVEAEAVEAGALEPIDDDAHEPDAIDSAPVVVHEETTPPRSPVAVHVQPPLAEEDDEGEDEPLLDLGDVEDDGPVRPSTPGNEAASVDDVETLLQLYTEEMRVSQEIMNERIDAAVGRIDSVARLMLTRMGISADEIEPHTGPTAEQARLKEDDARTREHEIELEEMKDEMRRLRAALDAERAASVARGVERRPYPQHMSEVREWFDATLSGRVHIVSKAWKSMRKSSNEYPPHAVERMCKALELLAGPGLDMHCGDPETKRLWTEGLAELRLDQSYDNTSTSGPVGKSERTITYQSEKLFMNRHLRGSESGHNDRDLLRIYYVHHSETNQIVVGHLPSHLTTAAS